MSVSWKQWPVRSSKLATLRGVWRQWPCRHISRTVLELHKHFRRGNVTTNDDAMMDQARDGLFRKGRSKQPNVLTDDTTHLAFH